MVPKCLLLVIWFSRANLTIRIWMLSVNQKNLNQVQYPLPHSQSMYEPISPESTTSSEKRSRKPWSPPRIKTLTEEDLEKYSIFDVIMPLPGTDVAYPGGMLGEKYREFLRADGLDPDDFTRKQRLGAYNVRLVLLNWKSQRLHTPWII
jgi:hypothetical protein